MDFRRIEWIFLVIFVAIDIFLFVSFRQSGTVQTSGSAQTGDSNGTIIKEMKSDQIKFSQPSAKVLMDTTFRVVIIMIWKIRPVHCLVNQRVTVMTS